jgi:predicted ATPase/class 3 adenylate cyclase
LIKPMSEMSSPEARLIESFAPPPLRLVSDAPHTPPERQMALLWLDVVGFTRITGHFLEQGPAGTEDLARLLEQHFDGLIDTIIAHGGEPLMFAGDALLAGWPCNAAAPTEALLSAASCGLAILAGPGAGLPSGETVTLHAILAFGPCRTAEIGTRGLRLHVTIGSGLADLQSASTARAKGQLLVSPAARAALGEAATLQSVGADAVVVTSLRGVGEPRPLTIAPLGPEARARLLALVPLPIASRLDRRLLDWTAELRRVTVVFIALPGLDHAAPDALPRLEAVFAAAAPKIQQQDGFIQQLRIDESGAHLLVLFGIPPVAHPDDPVRAVRCAIEVRDALRTIGQRTSIGVATGRLFCGLIGNDTFRAWTIYGEAVNLAARLKGVQGGAIQCDEATVRGARNSVLFAPVGRSQVRGMGLNVPVWTPGRQDRAEGDELMHGRAQELAQVLDVLHGASAPDAPRLVFVEAESGMGKSRFLSELHQRASADGATVLSGGADRIERSVPYRGWRGVFGQLLGLDAKLPDDVQRAAALQALGPAMAPQAALLNAVLQLDLPETPEVEAMAAAQRPDFRLALLLSLLRRAAAERSLLVTLDDAQWLDEESWALVVSAVREVAGLCLVMATQPMEDSRRIEELIEAGAIRMTLGGLSDAEQDRLALTRLGAERIAPELASLLRARTRGHPFFCLELAQALHDEGLIEVVDGTCHIARHASADRLPLPDTVHGAVTRRIDRLDLESQVTLKVASTAGLRFPTALVIDVHPTAQAEQTIVAGHLTTHHRAGMLRPDHVDDLAGYEFCHGIVRDVAYDLMLYGQRKQLHRAIASWYEQNSGSDLSRVYALIAHHMEAAGEPARAAHYLMLEAERVFGLGLVRQSVAIGLQGARLLGVDLPTDVVGLQKAIGAEMEQISLLLNDRRPEELVDLPPLQDQQVASLIPLLLSLAPYAYQSQQPELFALLGATCLRLTLRHGQGPFTPDVYAMYSVVYAAMTGDRPGGAAWSRLGLQLQPAHKGASFARCAFIHVWFHNHWSASLEEGVALSRAGADAGLGDHEIAYGCFNLAACVVLLAAAGRPIPEILSTSERHLERNGGRVPNAYFTVKLERQAALALAGQTLAFDSLSDATTDADAEFAAMRDARFSNQVGSYYTVRLRLSALGGDWRGALEFAESARELLPFFAGQPGEVVLVYYRGAAALLLAAFGGADDADALRSEGWDCAEQLRNWESLNEPWLGPRADLLEGLLEAGAGRYAEAGSLLRNAAERAGAAANLEDKAFALECLARLQRAAGETPAALAEALDAYAAWGATDKRARLLSEFA